MRKYWPIFKVQKVDFKILRKFPQRQTKKTEKRRSSGVLFYIGNSVKAKKERTNQELNKKQETVVRTKLKVKSFKGGCWMSPQQTHKTWPNQSQAAMTYHSLPSLPWPTPPYPAFLSFSSTGKEEVNDEQEMSYGVWEGRRRGGEKEVVVVVEEDGKKRKEGNERERMKKQIKR